MDHKQKTPEFLLPEQFVGTAVKEIMSTIRDSLTQGNIEAILDFKNTVFIDSFGIGSLASLARTFKTAGGNIFLYNLEGSIHELFVDTGLDRIFSIGSSQGVHKAEIDIFETSVDIKLDVDNETIGDVAVLHCRGVMNHPLGSRYFKQQVLLAMANHQRIILDLEELTFFDSLSVSVVLNLNKLLKTTGGHMRICGANFIVNDLFTTLNINQIIPFFSCIDDAVKDWR